VDRYNIAQVLFDPCYFGLYHTYLQIGDMKQYLESSLPNFKSTKPVNEAENDPNNDAEQVEMFGKLCEPLLDVENSQNQLTVFSKLVTYSVVVFTIITVHLMMYDCTLDPHR